MTIDVGLDTDGIGGIDHPHPTDPPPRRSWRRAGPGTAYRGSVAGSRVASTVA